MPSGGKTNFRALPMTGQFNIHIVQYLTNSTSNDKMYPRIQCVYWWGKRKSQGWVQTNFSFLGRASYSNSRSLRSHYLLRHTRTYELPTHAHQRKTLSEDRIVCDVINFDHFLILWRVARISKFQTEKFSTYSTCWTLFSERPDWNSLIWLA